MKRAQASLEVLIMIAVILILFSISTAISVDKSTQVAKAKSNLDLKSECLRLSSAITDAFVAGSGTSLNTTVSAEVLVFADSRLLAIQGKDGQTYCSVPINRISNGSLSNFSLPAGQLTIENHNGMIHLKTQVVDTSPPKVISTSPSGTIRDDSPTLILVTDEAATCKYDDTDQAYSSMASTFSGTGTSHTASIGPLPDGDYVYYARCADTAGNVMTQSTTIRFTVNTTVIVVPEPTLQTDKLDYVQNENVTITGSNYTADGAVTIWIRDFNETSAPGYPLSITANSVGNISHVWSTNNYCSGLYTVEAQDQTSGIVANTTFNITYTSVHSSYSSSPEATPDWKAEGKITPADVKASDNVWGYFDVNTAFYSWVEFDFPNLGASANEAATSANITIEYQDEKTTFTNKEVRCLDTDSSTWITIGYPPNSKANKGWPRSKYDKIVTYSLDPACCDSELNDIRIRYGFFTSADSGKAYVDWAKIDVATETVCTAFGT